MIGISCFLTPNWSILINSRARGDYRKKSDIDLAILCPNSTDKDWISVMDIIEDADSLLKIDCIKFDKNKRNKSTRRKLIRRRSECKKCKK